MTVLQQTLDELVLLIKAPFIVPEMWWMVVPLFAILMLMTFYFGRYIREKIGWNTALSNSVVLFFVGIDLLRTVYHYKFPPTIWNFAWHPIPVLIILLVMFEGALLSYEAFRHGLPSAVMFFMASPLSVNLQAYVLTAIVYLQIKPTIYTFYAAIILLFSMYIVLKSLQLLEHWLIHAHILCEDKPDATRKKK